MNDKIPQTIRNVLRAAPAAALATGIVCPSALADPGDLDPTFANVGRFTPPDDLRGRAQSLVTQEDNYVFAGGGLEFDFFTYETDTLGFADRLSVDGILDAGFNAPDLVDTLVAADSPLRLVVAADAAGTVLGFAAISLTYSLVDPTPDKRRHCWLKELYVRSSNRSLGVGRALMAWVARYAVEHGCARIDWPVQAANARGQAFYEGLGATQVVERLSYRLSEPGLSRLAGIGPESSR